MEKRELPLEVRHHDMRTEAAMSLISDAILMAQHLLHINAAEMTAILAQVAGQATGCLDAKAESVPERVEDGLVEYFKDIFLKNFDYAYNNHRAMHENAECKVKPEPKIV